MRKEKKACPATGKIRINDKAVAEIILAKLKKRRDRQEKNIYLCEHCGDYHLTKQEVLK